MKPESTAKSGPISTIIPSLRILRSSSDSSSNPCNLPPPRGVFARLWTGGSRAFLLAAGAGAGTCCSCCCCCGGPGRESGATCCRGAVLARGEVAYGGTSRGWYTLGDGWACGGGYAGLRCWDGCGDTGFLAGGATLMNLGCCCSGCCWFCCCCC